MKFPPGDIPAQRCQQFVTAGSPATVVGVQGPPRALTTGRKAEARLRAQAYKAVPIRAGAERQLGRPQKQARPQGGPRILAIARRGADKTVQPGISAQGIVDVPTGDLHLQAGHGPVVDLPAGQIQSHALAPGLQLAFVFANHRGGDAVAPGHVTVAPENAGIEAPVIRTVFHRGRQGIVPQFEMLRTIGWQAVLGQAGVAVLEDKTVVTIQLPK